MTHPVSIAGVGMTPFGVLEKSIIELAQDAALLALDDSHLSDSKIDRLVIGCQNPEEFTGIGHLSTVIADQLGIVPAGATRVETGPSSGASAFEAAYSLVASGLAESVLVVGVEKMSEVERSIASKILAKMMSIENESRYGATPTLLAALIARRYMHDYGLTRDELSLIPVKAHRNGAKNPLAHFRNETNVELVSSSRYVAEPLTLFDCSPTSDGAAAALLVSEGFARKQSFSNSVPILGIGHATDHLALQHRRSLTSFQATRDASRQAFAMADLSPSDIDVCELHDAFSILELVNMEDIGLAPRGSAIELVKNKVTEIYGDIPVNTTGGLKARGHPTGATGLAQIHDIIHQLRGTSPRGLQVDAVQIGLAHNIGGLGNNIVVTILGHR